MRGAHKARLARWWRWSRRENPNAVTWAWLFQYISLRMIFNAWYFFFLFSPTRFNRQTSHRPNFGDNMTIFPWFTYLIELYGLAAIAILAANTFMPMPKVPRFPFQRDVSMKTWTDSTIFRRHKNDFHCILTFEPGSGLWNKIFTVMLLLINLI